MVIDEKKQKEIIDALCVIRNTCIECGCCAKCPFSDKDGSCLVSPGSITPMEWEIKDKESVWKAVY